MFSFALGFILLESNNHLLWIADMPLSKKVDLNLLRVFVSAYQTQSVTKTAEQLDLTQSAVSNALNRLKDNLGNELFTRTGRGIKATRFAQELFQQIEPSYLTLETVLQGLHKFDPVESYRTFYVYCNEAIFHSLRQRLDTAIHDTNISVVLQELPPNEELIYEDLRLEKVDLLIDIAAPNSSQFQSQVVQQDHLCCVVSQQHPRITEDQVTKEQYLLERHAIMNMRRFNLLFIDWLVSDVLPPRKIYSEHNSLLSMLSALTYSDAVAVVPESIAVQYKDIFKLRMISFPFETKSFDSHLIWLKKMETNPANTWLRQLITDIIR